METKQQAACYIRVSTEEQTEYSPEAQRRALEGYARQHGYSIDPAHVYVDAGISGRRAETRPAFMAMIAAAKGKPPPFTAILVHKFDRFARNREDSIVYKSLLRRQCGVQVISITEHLEDDRMGLILEAMLEAMAEYYSINLADEVRKGMVEKARRGELQTAPPFGYRVEGHTLVPVEEEARVVQALYQRFLAGESMAALARWTRQLGVLTHRGNPFDSRRVKYI
ncbi:MAG: recombinase family protein, partial [Evtepia sp.]|nr:recombinase family protein [Evtepia sp.]